MWLEAREAEMGSYQATDRFTVSPTPDLLMLAKHARAARLKSSADFPRHVFRDAAWDIMLALFIASAEGQPLCVKDTMAVSGDSAPGTIRRLDGLEAAGLIGRDYDPHDHRRILVLLTVEGHSAMIAFLRHLFDMGEPGRAPSVSGPPHPFPCPSSRAL
jgi:hypothetical protein